MKRITTILLANTLKATWIALKMIRHLSAELTEFKHSLIAEIERLQSEEQVLSASDEAYAAGSTLPGKIGLVDQFENSEEFGTSQAPKDCKRDPPRAAPIVLALLRGYSNKASVTNGVKASVSVCAMSKSGSFRITHDDSQIWSGGYHERNSLAIEALTTQPRATRIRKLKWAFGVMQHLSPLITTAATRTIENLEKSTAPDDPKIIEIKRHVLLRLAEIQEPSSKPRRERMLLEVNPARKRAV